MIFDGHHFRQLIATEKLRIGQMGLESAFVEPRRVFGSFRHDVLDDHVAALAREVLVVRAHEAVAQLLRLDLVHFTFLQVLQCRVHHVRLDLLVEVLLRFVDLNARKNS